MHACTIYSISQFLALSLLLRLGCGGADDNATDLHVWLLQVRLSLAAMFWTKPPHPWSTGVQQWLGFLSFVLNCDISIAPEALHRPWWTDQLFGRGDCWRTRKGCTRRLKIIVLLWRIGACTCCQCKFDAVCVYLSDLSVTTSMWYSDTFSFWY